jgi:hypothetical protein
VIERCTRVGPDSINYSFTVEIRQPSLNPGSAEYRFHGASGLSYEYACHEGNYALQASSPQTRAGESRRSVTWCQVLQVSNSPIVSMRDCKT